MLPSFKQAAIDGKTLRGSTDGDKSPLHMVSAFATDFCIVLGEEAVADKSNKITAILLLFEALAVKGCLMSIDLMGCQKEIDIDQWLPLPKGRFSGSLTPSGLARGSPLSECLETRALMSGAPTIEHSCR